MSQGKAWDKEKVIEALEHYFVLGYSVNRACELAGFPQSTIATWLVDDDELRQEIKAWQGSVGAKSREVVANSIAKHGNREDAKWWLERREKKDFSTRKELTGADGEAVGVQIKRLETDYEKLGKQASGQMVEDEPPVQDQGQRGESDNVPAEPDPAPTPGGEGQSPAEPDPQS